MKPTAQSIDPAKRTEVRPERMLTRAEAALILRVFLLLLVVPMVFEMGRMVSKTNLLTSSTRSGTQRLLTWYFKEASPSIHLGHEGWMFDQKELDRLLATRTADAPANEKLTQLTAELKTRNIPLLLVCVPERATLYPEKLREGRYWDPIRSNGEKARLDALRASGVEVLDVTDALWKLRERKQVYFRRDSHWTPEAMKQVALLTEKQVREKYASLPGNETPLITATILSHPEAGDLTRKLDPARPDGLFAPEQADVVSLGGTKIDDQSPVLLLGSDLMWVFDDETQNFGGDSSAGFVSHFALLLQKPLDVDVWPLDDLKQLDGKKLVVLVLPMSEVLP